VNDDSRTVAELRQGWLSVRNETLAVTMTAHQWRQLVDALGPAADDILDDIFGEVDWDD
jgi:hypothetical protein